MSTGRSLDCRSGFAADGSERRRTAALWNAAWSDRRGHSISCREGNRPFGRRHPPSCAVGLLLLGLAAWRLASRTAFADRAVTATAVIDDVDQGPFLQSADGQRSFTVYATVRYEVDGTLAQGRVALSGCGRGSCPASRQRGDTITIAYDPLQLNSVDLASRVVGRHPLLDPRVLALVLMGVIFLVAAAVDLVLGP
jgi:Protein of unknown function (DUF3592)